jgi:hypothetical protein
MLRSVMLVLMTVTLFAVPGAALAQRDAGAKARGDYSGTFWSTRSAGRSVQHARDYAVDAQNYVKSTSKPSAPYLRAEAKEIGKNVQAAKAELNYLKTNAGKEQAKAIASIQGHLKAAEDEQAA